MTRTLLLTALLTLPTFAAAQSSCAEKHQAQNCAAGTMWNDETKACEQVVSS
ncbi:hypothetical protein GCM10011360_09280 [Primorskyibacter flagellatus]|uniref:Chitin-binding type-2 domain-containing protein n=1 Tax=Primorskyibacter flagellatus TaxID=1387277 RepID=A0A917ECA3_9RHOB|nr:hypothetical protein [Primorskyibacter flagellatus]GGE22929.1 hypothetical protein GCM10011360_09280 [Primorskyibacter flagellatus]